MNCLADYCNLHVDGKIIPPKSWSICWEDDGDCIGYYYDGHREFGIQSSQIEIHDPAYGKVFPR